MAKYRVDTENGSYEVETQDSSSQKQPQMENQNILGQSFNVPGAAVRSAIQGKGYVEGAVNPSQVPSFQELQKKNPLLDFLAGGAPIGAGLDMITDPASLLMGLIGGGVPKVASRISKMTKIDSALNQSVKAKTALDKLRTTLGQAKQLAIQEVSDVPVELEIGSNVSKRVVEAIKNPVYKVEFTEEGAIKGTIGNLDRIKDAVGDLISSPRIWEEAPKTELRQIKLFYGRVAESMKQAAKKVGKDISEPLKAYSDFMDRYYLVNKTLVDSVGNNMANKLKQAFKIGAEPAVKEAWKDVAKASPEIKSVMGSMNRREILKQLLKYSGIGATVGLAGKGASSILRRD